MGNPVSRWLLGQRTIVRSPCIVIALDAHSVEDKRIGGHHLFSSWDGTVDSTWTR